MSHTTAPAPDRRLVPDVVSAAGSAFATLQASHRPLCSHFSWASRVMQSVVARLDHAAGPLADDQEAVHRRPLGSDNLAGSERLRAPGRRLRRAVQFRLQPSISYGDSAAIRVSYWSLADVSRAVRGLTSTQERAAPGCCGTMAPMSAALQSTGTCLSTTPAWFAHLGQRRERRDGVEPVERGVDVGPRVQVAAAAIQGRPLIRRPLQHMACSRVGSGVRCAPSRTRVFATLVPGRQCAGMPGHRMKGVQINGTCLEGPAVSRPALPTPQHLVGPGTKAICSRRRWVPCCCCALLGGPPSILLLRQIKRR